MANLMKKLPLITVIAVLALGAGMVVFRFVAPSANAVVVNIKVPKLSRQAALGKETFDANCAACHGNNAAGSEQGPPLVHDIYNPGHHADQAFLVAAQQGVRGHHWRFGNMPAQPQVTREEISSIVRYVRELQTANGIFFKPHRM